MAKRKPITHTETRQLYTLWIDKTLLMDLKRVKERDGIAESESIRRATRVWLDAKLGNREPRRRTEERSSEIHPSNREAGNALSKFPAK